MVKVHFYFFTGMVLLIASCHKIMSHGWFGYTPSIFKRLLSHGNLVKFQIDFRSVLSELYLKSFASLNVFADWSGYRGRGGRGRGGYYDNRDSRDGYTDHRGGRGGGSHYDRDDNSFQQNRDYGRGGYNRGAYVDRGRGRGGYRNNDYRQRRTSGGSESELREASPGLFSGYKTVSRYTVSVTSRLAHLLNCSIDVISNHAQLLDCHTQALLHNVRCTLKDCKIRSLFQNQQPPDPS